MEGKTQLFAIMYESSQDSKWIVHGSTFWLVEKLAVAPIAERLQFYKSLATTDI